MLLSATAVTDPSGNYLMSRSMVYDMTERKRAEDEIRRVNRAHRALSTCNQALVRATDESTLVQQIARSSSRKQAIASAGSAMRNRMPPGPCGPSRKRDSTKAT